KIPGSRWPSLRRRLTMVGDVYVGLDTSFGLMSFHPPFVSRNFPQKSKPTRARIARRLKCSTWEDYCHESGSLESPQVRSGQPGAVSAKQKAESGPVAPDHHRGNNHCL